MKKNKKKFCRVAVKSKSFVSLFLFFGTVDFSIGQGFNATLIIPNTVDPLSQETSIPSLKLSSILSSFPPLSPTSRPTITSSNKPTEEQTSFPTSSSSQSPSLALSSAPTIIGTETPTLIKSEKPTISGSDAPSTTPTYFPTTSPPTTQPFPEPTSFPTEQPSMALSLSPTEIPSTTPTYLPTSFPTNAPTATLIREGKRLSNLRIELSPISSIKAINESWIEGTTEHIINFHEENNPFLQNVQLLTFFTREIVKKNEVTGETEVTVVYEHSVKYTRPADQNMTPEKFVEQPFNNLVRREKYIEQLQSKNSKFSNLNSVTVVRFPNENIPNPNVRLIIIIAVASAILVILIFILLFCFRKQRRIIQGGAFVNEEQTNIINANERSSDEVSRARERPSDLGVKPSNESLSEYEDRSIGTVDYDYLAAFPGDSSLSSAGGTLGDLTRGTLGTPGPSPSLFSTDESFDNVFTGTNANVKQTVIEILAPPGKLGVVIDTPDDGAPVVHAIKDSSVIASKLKVGDQLVAVDEEDVRKMTAIKVSKMISRKSGNPTRKLTIIRSTIVE